MKIGLFFGTFNPLHNGHLAIANYIAENTDIDEVWFVPSPDSPFKKHDTDIIPFHERCHLISVDARMANPCLLVSEIEGYMPTPCYTVNTMSALVKQYPGHDFTIIFGEDNLRILGTFHEWDKLLFGPWSFLIVPRSADNKKNTINDVVDTLCEMAGRETEGVKITILNDCPNLDISSSLIRQQMKEGKRIAAYVPQFTHRYLNAHPFK